MVKHLGSTAMCWVWLNFCILLWFVIWSRLLTTYNGLDHGALHALLASSLSGTAIFNIVPKELVFYVLPLLFDHRLYRLKCSFFPDNKWCWNLEKIFYDYECQRNLNILLEQEIVSSLIFMVHMISDKLKISARWDIWWKLVWIVW